MHGAHQLLGATLAPPLDVSLIHAAKQGIHLHQRRIDHLVDGSQRMSSGMKSSNLRSWNRLSVNVSAPRMILALYRA